MTNGAQVQSTTTPGLFFERRYSARTLFNLQASKPVAGPVYQQTPHKQWGQLSCALSGCGSLRSLARKVYTELEPESVSAGSKKEVTNSDVSNLRVSKVEDSKSPLSKSTTYECRCGCGTTMPPQVSTVSADSRTLAVILQSTNSSMSANALNTPATKTSESYFAKW